MRTVLDYSTPMTLWCEEDGPVVRTDLPESWAGVVSDDEQRWTFEHYEELKRERRSLFFGDPRAGPDIALRASCPYCKSHMYEVRSESQGTRGQDDFRAVQVTACDHCGFWDGVDLYRWLDDDSGGRDLGSHLQWLRSRGRLRRFPFSDMSLPLESLRRHVERLPDDLAHVHPTTLERMVGSVFSEAFDCEAHHVGGPGDNGIDLLLLDADNPIAIQVKRRSNQTKSEGVAIVRDFLGALLLEGHARGIVVSTAHQYSRAARQAVQRARELGLATIELVDADTLTAICRAAAPADAPYVAAAPTLGSPRPPVWPRH